MHTGYTCTSLLSIGGSFPLHLLLAAFRLPEDTFQVTIFKEVNFALVKVYRPHSYHMRY